MKFRTTKTRGRSGLRSNPKDPAAMTASEINRELDKLEALRSRHTAEMIASGRGHDRYSDVVSKTDKLSRAIVDTQERVDSLRHEVERRYGPRAPSRLPSRGFGPLKNPVDFGARSNPGLVLRRNHHIAPGGTFYTPGGRKGTTLGPAKGGYYRVRWSDGTLGSVRDTRKDAIPIAGSGTRKNPEMRWWEAKPGEPVDLPLLVERALVELRKGPRDEQGRDRVSEVWHRGHSELRRAVDGWIVQMKHPLGFVPGSPEGRFCALVREVSK